MRLLAILVFIAFGACSRSRARDVDGAALFAETCARCHALDGRGDPTARRTLGVPDMTDPAWQARLSDEDLRRAVRQGSKSKKMPPFGARYTVEQLAAIVAHVRTLRAR